MRLPLLLCIWLLTFPSYSHSRDYIIYSVSQDFPMGDGKELKKNFYLNMGSNQGVQQGTLLDVFRIVSRLDPYHSNKRYNYVVKIGELKVFHSEEDASIAQLVKILDQVEDPLFEVPGLMIGDRVKVHVKD